MATEKISGNSVGFLCFLFCIFLGLVICFFFLRDGVAFMVKSLSVSNEMIHNLDDFILIFVG